MFKPILLLASLSTLGAMACGGVVASNDDATASNAGAGGASAGAAGSSANAGSSSADAGSSNGGAAGSSGSDDTTPPSGAYYFLMTIDPPPMRQQLQLYAHLRVEQESGRFRVRFFDADRTPEMNDRNGCPSDCGERACRLLPVAECVVPSMEQGDIDNWRDFKPFGESPDGYTFQVDGLAAKRGDGTFSLSTDPFDIDLLAGSAGIVVFVEDATFTAEIMPDPAEPSRLRGKGALTVGSVKVNGMGDEPTQGVLELMTLSPDEQAEVESFGNPYPVADPFSE